MKLLTFIASFWCLVLANEEEFKIPDDFDFNSWLNSTYPTEEDLMSAPCHTQAPGFKLLGIMITFIVVFVFSFVGNSIVVFLVCYMKKGMASTDIYLIHLAMADLLFCLTLPFWAVYVHSGWIFGTVLCKILSGFQEVAVYCGVFLLACISIDRYFAIVRGKQSSHNILVKVVCGVVWLVAGALSLPVVIQRESMYAEDLDENICYENLTGESIHHWHVPVHVLCHTIGFFVPLLVMAVCYICTVVKIFHARNQQKAKAMRVILAVVLVFILCWLPFNITVLIDTLIRGGSLPVETCETLYTLEKILHVTQVIAFMHCAVNPVLYVFIWEKFRNQFISVLYKHGLISERFYLAYSNSDMSVRPRNTCDNVMTSSHTSNAYFFMLQM